MRKLFNALLVLTMLFGLTLTTHAQESPSDMANIKVYKRLDAQGSNPAETFNFKVMAKRKVDGPSGPIPDLADFSISVAADASSGSLDLELPTFAQVGVYEYDIAEIAGNTAGMIYDTDFRTLVVQVIRDGDDLIRIAYLKYDGEKPEEFILSNNAYNSGKLTVDKVLAGNFTDPDDLFTVVVTLTVHEGKDFDISRISHTGGTLVDLRDDEGKITLTYTVKGGDDFTIENIPYDVDYSIVESDHGDYTPKYDNNANGALDAVSISTTITNTRNRDIDMGITTDNLPYLLALGFAVSGIGYFVVRRKREH